MAGGTFDPGVSKIRPGVYINFIGTVQETIASNPRGIVLIPLLNHNWGPEKQFIEITSSNPDGQLPILGYSVFSGKRSMLPIREALKLATKVIVYIPKAGEKAKSKLGEIDITATFGGTRGNEIKVTSTANPVSGFDVVVYLGTDVVKRYEGISTAADLKSDPCDYVEFSGDGAIVESAGVSLAGGTDGTTTASDMTAFLDDMEGIYFNTLAFPVSGEDFQSLKEACKSKVKYLRDSTGKYIKAVIPDYPADYEGIINVTNSVAVNGEELTTAEACAWVAAADASASYVQSNTYVAYEGATSVIGKKTHEQAVASIKNGEFFFSPSEDGKVIVEYDINSLTTFTPTRGTSYRKNRVMRVYDSLGTDLKTTFPPNKYNNTETDWDVMEGIGRALLKSYADAGAIKNVDEEADFVVVREKSEGDETVFNVGVQPVDSAEKLYFNVYTR